MYMMQNQMSGRTDFIFDNFKFSVTCLNPPKDTAVLTYTILD